MVHGYLHPLTLNKEERKMLGDIYQYILLKFEVSRLMYTEKNVSVC